MRWLLALLCVAAALATGTPAQAATYFVDKDSLGGTCSDTGNGAEATPFCTLHRALDGNPNREAGGSGSGLTPVATSGDTVHVKTATYVDIQSTLGSIAIGFAIPSGVTLRAYTPAGCTDTSVNSTCRHKPVLQRQYGPTDYTGTPNYVSGLNGDKTWPVTGFSGTCTSGTLDGFIVNTYPGALDGGQVFIGSGCSNLTVENNAITRPGYDGTEGDDGGGACGNYTAVYFSGPSSGTAFSTGTIVRNNIISGAKNTSTSNPNDSNCAGLKLYGQQNVDVRGNRFTDNDVGIHYKINNDGGTFQLNYFHNQRNRCWRATEGGANNTAMPTFKNNICAFVGHSGSPPSEGAIEFFPEPTNSVTSGPVLRNNTFWLAGHADLSGAGPGLTFDGGGTRDWTVNPASTWWNNLVVAGDETNNEGMLSVRADYRAAVGDQPPDNSNDGACLQYNAWAKVSGATGLRIKVNATNVTTLGDWQAFADGVGAGDVAITAASAAALVTDLFASGTPTATGTDPSVYKPRVGGPLAGAGNTVCMGGGSVVNIGAYETGNEQIGPVVGTSATGLGRGFTLGGGATVR